MKLTNRKGDNKMNLIGRDYKHNDYEGKIVKFITEGSFKNCYEVKVKNVKNNHETYWWFKKEILESRYQ